VEQQCLLPKNDLEAGLRLIHPEFYKWLEVMIVQSSIHPYSDAYE